MSQNVFHHFNSPLVSQEVNTRFGDLVGGSIISGFRFAVGSTNHLLSLVKGSDASNVMATWSGVRVEETTDLIDAISLAPNTTATDRMDSIYMVYVHGLPILAATYVVIVGDALGNPATLANKTTYTLIGYVRVPANNAAITSDCYLPNITGLAIMEVAAQARFHDLVTVEKNMTVQGALFLPQGPVGLTDATNKTYVDTLVGLLGLTPKAAVRVTTTGNDIALTGLQTIDGVSLAAGDRILVRDQTTAAQNGIYTVAAGAWTRSTDADGVTLGTLSGVSQGLFCLVTEGAVMVSTGWYLITPDPITLDTTALTFIQYSAAAVSAAGEGLSRSGNLLSVVPATTTTLGGVKDGDGVVISGAGILTVDAGDGVTFDAGSTPNKKIIVNVGSGLVLNGTSPNKVVAPDFTVTGGDAGSALTVARGDHIHDARYYTQTQMYGTGLGAQLHWDNLTNVPPTFPPSPHTHPISDVTGLQSALDAKQDTIIGAASTIASANLATHFALASDVSGKVVVSTTTDTELGYVSGVTSSLQTQLDAKQDTIVGAASTIASANLALNFALVSDGSGKVVVSPVTASELGFVSGATSSLQTQLNNSVTTANLAATGGAALVGLVTITGITATNVQQALQALKDYTDNAKQGIDLKDSVRAATTANITLSGPQTIDGVVLIAGNRVLVKDQTTGSENGIYVVAAGAWSRSTDADTSAKVTTGMSTFVEEGTLNVDAGFALNTPNPIVLGTTSLNFAQNSGAGVITAGAGLTKSGSVLSLTSGVMASPGTYQSVQIDTYGRAVAGTNPTTLAGYNITDGQSLITGAASTVTASNLAASKAVVSDVSGKIVASATSAAEVAFVSGVTSAIQPQFTGKANAVHTHDDIDIKDYQITASSQDTTTHVYKVTQYKRTSDNTLYLQSTLSNPDTNGNYQTVTLLYYDALGTSVISTKTWTLVFDANNVITTKTVA